MGSGQSAPQSIIDVDSKDEPGITDFHNAAANNDLSLVKQFLSQGTDVDLRNRCDETPLHYAASKNVDESHYEVAEILLKNEADVDAKNNVFRTPLYFLVQRGNLKIVQLFLNHKAAVDAEDCYDRNLLFPAVHNLDNLEVLKLLIDKGLDINHQDKKGKTPLSDVAMNNVDDNYLNVAKILLKNGAATNVEDHKRYTPLIRLAKNGNAKIFQLFLDHTTHLDEKRGEKLKILLFEAVEHNKNVDTIQLLIDLGIDINYRYDNESGGQTVMHFACGSETTKAKIIKCLLKNGANINITDFDGSTPLACAMYQSFMSFQKHEREWKEKVKLIVECTDLNINCSEESHILKWYENEPPGNYKKVLEHIAKLQTLNIPVHPFLLEEISRISLEYEYYINDECHKELERAKNAKLGDSWISFYNLLMDSRRKLKNYAGNENLIKAFEKSDCEKKYPIYGASMVENIKKAIRRRELFDKSVILLSDCLPIFNPTHLIVRDILDCILSKKDLSKFCEQN